ncbi:hypothetical protein [Cupriavidus sp. USMAHM13]|nr:hypothetical protein [Cupriavidus sp. USMAHM13]
MVYPIRFELRAAVGRGPLEALELRNPRVPERIFVAKAAQVQAPAPVRSTPAQHR